jgi:isoleucyl-tRNA synthetase
MTNYKNTLNLPYTTFSMKANLKILEIKLLDYWEKIEVYKQIRNTFNGHKKFILHDGPPYANGNIHIGHAVNKILKDIIIKSKHLSGLDAPYIPGWDCHGLPIELEIKKNKIKFSNIIEFRQQCRIYANKQIVQQKKDFQRLGIIADWNNSYNTAEFSYEADTIKILSDLVNKGYIYKSIKPVYWCVNCKSSLSDSEVEYSSVESLSIYVKYYLDNNSTLLLSNILNIEIKIPVFAIIWTTTPWSLIASTAIAISNNISYVLIKYFNTLNNKYELMLVAKLLIDEIIIKNTNIIFDKIIIEINSNMLLNLSCKHPLYDHKLPIIIGEHVTINMGTGLVHIAPSYGIDDYKLALKYKLNIINYINDAGFFNNDIEYVQNIFYKESIDIICNILKNKDLLWNIHKITHNYPHCWRHKTEVIYRSTPQWFINLNHNQLMQKSLNEINNIKWKPLWGKINMTNMINNRVDWCISRQRYWGVPISIFSKNNELHPKTESIFNIIIDRIKKSGIDIWFDKNYITNQLSEYNLDTYQKNDDVLDVWFDSGVSNICILKKNKDLQFPADLYLEGSDQYRGWFQSSLLISMMINGQAPYKEVLTHGFVVDHNGHKMSKSKGNVISPQDIINNHGAEILRLWVSSTDYHSELSLSDNILKHMSDIYRKIRNTIRFLLANLFDFNPKENFLSLNNLLLLDKWAINQAINLHTDIQNNYDNYHFHKVLENILLFCTNDMSGFFLDIIKDRLYTCKKNSLHRRSAQTAMYLILSYLVRWISPILTFTAEEVWLYMVKQFSLDNQPDSVLLLTWNNVLNVNYNINNDYLKNQDWIMLRAIRSEINKELEKMRALHIISSSLQAIVYLSVDESLINILNKIKDELHFLFIVSKVKLSTIEDSKNDNIKYKTSIVIDGLSLFIKVSNANKCARCWHYSKEIGENILYPSICNRCIDNIYGEGEKRLFL